MRAEGDRRPAPRFGEDLVGLIGALRVLVVNVRQTGGKDIRGDLAVNGAGHDLLLGRVSGSTMRLCGPPTIGHDA